MYNGEDNTLSSVQGVYLTGTATGNGAFHYSSSAATGYLRIEGGYGPNCTTFASDSTRVRLDGNHASQVLALLNQNADIIISQLTIQNGEATTNGGGIAIASGASPTITLTIIKDNHTTAQGGGLAVYAVGSAISDYLRLETNLITNNSADQDAGAGILSAATAYTTLRVTQSMATRPLRRVRRLPERADSSSTPAPTSSTIFSNKTLFTAHISASAASTSPTTTTARSAVARPIPAARATPRSRRISLTLQAAIFVWPATRRYSVTAPTS